MQNYNLPDVNFDNTFDGVEFTLPSKVVYDLTEATAKIQLRLNPNTPIIKEFISPFKLLISLPYTVIFPQQIIDIPAGEYKWDLKIFFADGREKTYIGGTWKIKSVITR